MPNQAGTPPTGQDSPGFFASLGQRVLVHICAFAAVGALVPDDADWFVTLGVYFGIICLVPRGPMDALRWGFPVVCGLVQGLVLLVGGLPAHMVLFWAGAQSWVQRVAQMSPRVADWLVTPFMLMIACTQFEEHFAKFGWDGIGGIVVFFPVIFVIGYFLRRHYGRVRSSSLHKFMLEQALRRLQPLAGHEALNKEEQRQLGILLAQGMALEQAKLHEHDAGCALIERIDAVSHAAQKAAKPRGNHAGWPDKLFDSTWQRLAGNKKPVSLAENLRQCNAAIVECLQRPTARPDGLDPLAGYETQARMLLGKAGQAPAAIASHVEGIALTTFAMLKSMREDARDLPAGERFLQRYLPASDHIVDEYARLAASAAKREDVAQAVARAEEMLARLHKAFESEHAAMLANDSSSFTAELNALDKLLKMGGH